jgi:hypothetical protein
MFIAQPLDPEHLDLTINGDFSLTHVVPFRNGIACSVAQWSLRLQPYLALHLDATAADDNTYSVATLQPLPTDDGNYVTIRRCQSNVASLANAFGIHSPSLLGEATATALDLLSLRLTHLLLLRSNLNIVFDDLDTRLIIFDDLTDHLTNDEFLIVTVNDLIEVSQFLRRSICLIAL